MLSEIEKIRQIPGESFRRWFTDDYFDLIVWFDPDGEIVGFQLCYDRQKQEKALTWRQGRGFDHSLVDDGEGKTGKQKATPILLADGAFDRDPIAGKFLSESLNIDQDLARFVYGKLMSFPA